MKTRSRLPTVRDNDELAWPLGHLRFPEVENRDRKHLVDCLAYILLD